MKRIFSALAVWSIVVGASAFGSPGTIDTYAGGGSGDGILATEASLDRPSGIAYDQLGDLYIADTYAHRIRRVGSTGIITTVAGNGVPGFTGDLGPATSASLNTPTGIAFDSSGNLYISDTGNHRIRRVTLGLISTVAGNGVAGYSGEGLAVTVSLNGPTGLSVDPSNNVYIADSGNNRVRRINPSGFISTLAGNGTSGSSGDGSLATLARLNSPQGVAADALGSIYIADTNNHRIRQVTAGLVITTVAGTGSPGYSGDGGGAAAAALNSPSGLALDSGANIYIADRDNRRVRRLKLGFVFNTNPVNAAAGYIISTVAGNGYYSFSGDGGPATGAGIGSSSSVAFDPFGILAISDSGNNRVRGVTIAGTISTLAGNGTTTFLGDGGPATSAALSRPTGVAVDNFGNLYVADYEHHRIRKVDSSGTIGTVAGNGSAGFSGDGGPAIGGQLRHPTGVALDASGNLYVADTDNQRIRKIDLSGNISTIVGDWFPGFYGDGGPATQARLNYPTGVALDSSGNLYIADFSNNRIRKVDGSGMITTVAGNGSYAFSGDNGPATAASLAKPFAVALDGSGGYYIADTYNHRIRKVNAAATISTVAGNGISGFSGDGGSATSKSLSYPGGVCLDASGDLYISDTNNHRVRKVNTAGSISTVVGNGVLGFSGDGGPAVQARLNFPFPVAIDSAGRIFIPDYFNDRIRIVNV